jgi:plasmid stability protein
MQELMLTDLDDGILSGLRERALRRDRTLAGEGKAVLAEALRGKSPDEWAPVDAIYLRLVTSGGTFADCTELLGEDRDR